MIIKTLVENTSQSKDFGNEHGLSLYLETKRHRILFDVGTGGLFLENAKKLDVEIGAVDLVVISHGHSDHGGGLGLFLQKNKHAPVFIHNLAFEKHYALRSDGTLDFIGLDNGLKLSSRLIFTAKRFLISTGIEVFSINQPRKFPTGANRNLLVEQDGQKRQDPFNHEQNLVIEEEGKTFLFTGCAHNGITNILKHFQFIKGRIPDYVIGGFHLSSRSAKQNGQLAAVEEIGRLFSQTKTKYYTGHCTGLPAYFRLKSILGDQIDQLFSGCQLEI